MSTGFVTKYDQGLSGNAFKLDVYCDHTQWVTDGTKNKAGDCKILWTAILSCFDSMLIYFIG